MRRAADDDHLCVFCDRELITHVRSVDWVCEYAGRERELLLTDVLSVLQTFCFCTNVEGAAVNGDRPGHRTEADRASATGDKESTWRMRSWRIQE